MKKLLLLLLLSFSSLYASASQSPLDLNISNPYIGKSMLVYKDADANLEFDQVTKLSLDQFIPLKHDVFSCTFNTSAFWYRFELNNTQISSLSRLMVFEAPWLDYIQINIISPKGKTKQYEVGNTFDYEQRSIDHHFINQVHGFEPGISTVYIKVKTRDPFVFTASVLDENSFLKEQIQVSKYIGLLYGVLFAMLLYNLFLFFGIKEPYYAYYVLFVTAFMLMNASYNGYTFKLFFPEEPEVQNWMQSSSIFFFSLAGLLFAQSFLNLKIAYERLNRSINYMIYFLVVTAIMSAVVGGYRYHVMLAIVFSIIVSIYIFAIAFYSWKKGNQSARFFILGSISGLVGTVITALTVMGQIPYSHLTYKALDLGMIVDAVLLALALADRVRIAQEEKLIAEKESKTDVLTNLMNRRAYYEISANEVHRSMRYKTDMSLILIDIDDFKDFNDNYGHDVGDKALKHFADILMKMKREDDYAFRLGGDEFLILLPDTNVIEASHLAERIRDAVEVQKFYTGTYTLAMGTSYGVAQLQDDDTSIEQVEKRADQALYKAKEIKN